MDKSVRPPELKKTKNWSDGWLPKLRDNKRAAKADVALIISTALPKGVETFDLIDGVYVAHPRCAVPVALTLRQAMRGRLHVERIAGKDYTTLEAIKRMRELCRVQAKELGCSNGELDTREKNSSPKLSGSSRTAATISPQDALRAQLKQSRQEKPNKP